MTKEISSQYRFVSDGLQGRTANDVIRILTDTHTDFIFQGWLTEYPLYETGTLGYDYSHMRAYIQAIKTAMPGVRFGGGIQYEFIYPDQMNPYTGIRITRDEAWAMALDPTKWNINISKEEMQCIIANNFGWANTPDCIGYDPYIQMRAFLPDITNPDFYQMFLDLIKIQIDNGADSIWIDGLFGQSYLLEKLILQMPYRGTLEMEQARIAAHDAAMQVIFDIHTYAPTVEIISWRKGIDISLGTPALDGIMTTVTYQEVLQGFLNIENWQYQVDNIKSLLPGKKIYARIDYGEGTDTPLGAFSQQLSATQAQSFLRNADTTLTNMGVNFIYPVHGGYMGKDATILSYNISKNYDSLAFQTYETIKTLSNEKKNTIVSPSQSLFAVTAGLTILGAALYWLATSNKKKTAPAAPSKSSRTNRFY
jgi:hypothetical protein